MFSGTLDVQTIHMDESLNQNYILTSLVTSLDRRHKCTPVVTQLLDKIEAKFQALPPMFWG